MSQAAPQLYAPALQGQLLRYLGYTDAEADAWITSGFIVIDLAAVASHTTFSVISSDPINLLALDYDVGQYRLTPPHIHKTLRLLDIYTGSLFTPSLLTPARIWGAPGLLASRTAIDREAVRFSRARFNRVPYYSAQSAQEFRDITRFFLETASRAQGAVLFRGQTREHYLHRHPMIKNFLFGSEYKNEPSILTGAFRKSFDYNRHETNVRAVIFDVEFRLGGADYRWCWVENRYEQIPIAPELFISKGNAVGAAAIAQHYGIPTYGLDVTPSPETAWWFATHTCTANTNAAVFRPHVWTSRDPEDWPIVYVFQTSHAVLLAELGLPQCQRPLSQHGDSSSAGGAPTATPALPILSRRSCSHQKWASTTTPWTPSSLAPRQTPCIENFCEYETRSRIDHPSST